ncbi:hypothetical protein V498_05403 [Pseudogymnoascus sp. VKM F-4517 (FW-2822)]|nr:hypothetical protein V498_05403 [Pseudogymnoascus sp. VKM F-4517 (FW-2822)]
MKFKLSAVVLANLLAVLASAAPTNEAPAPEDGLVLSHTVETTDGTLSYYVSGPDSVAITKRATCGPSVVSCSNNNQGNTNVCRSLLNAIQTSGTVLGQKTRSVCKTSGATCCVSWGSDVADLHESNLYPGALNIFNRCNGVTTPAGGVVPIGSCVLPRRSVDDT